MSQFGNLTGKSNNPFANPALHTQELTRPATSVGNANSGMQKPSMGRVPLVQPAYTKLGSDRHLRPVSMQRATVVSALLHVLVPMALFIVFVLGLLLLSWILHWDFMKFFQQTPPQQKHDIEFTLVEDTHAKPPTKPLFKGTFNQRAGGKRNPRQAIKPAEPPATSAPPMPKAVRPQPKSQQAVQQPKPVAQTPVTPPQLPAPKAVEKSVVQKSTPKPKPVQAHVAPPTPTAQPAASATTAQSQPSATMQAPGGVGAMGSPFSNPQGGDSSQPGADVAADVDFGPFMAALEKRIKRNWEPPRGMQSRKVELRFYVNRAGQVLNVETTHSSGDEETDQAAIAAVRASAPFTGIPATVKEDVLPIEFTFDYNVLNPKNAKQALKF